uniref:WD_REPEATS_REGION domain-containing protein n=1 Tax=Macrostomum lignano TaxID=282301 RepID=A0A1I8FK67_9PLAT
VSREAASMSSATDMLAEQNGASPSSRAPVGKRSHLRLIGVAILVSEQQPLAALLVKEAVEDDCDSAKAAVVVFHLLKRRRMTSKRRLSAGLRWIRATGSHLALIEAAGGARRCHLYELGAGDGGRRCSWFRLWTSLALDWGLLNRLLRWSLVDARGDRAAKGSAVPLKSGIASAGGISSEDCVQFFADSGSRCSYWGCGALHSALISSAAGGVASVRCAYAIAWLPPAALTVAPGFGVGVPEDAQFDCLMRLEAGESPMACAGHSSRSWHPVTASLDGTLRIWQGAKPLCRQTRFKQPVLLNCGSTAGGSSAAVVLCCSRDDLPRFGLARPVMGVRGLTGYIVRNAQNRGVTQHRLANCRLDWKGRQDPPAAAPHGRSRRQLQAAAGNWPARSAQSLAAILTYDVFGQAAVDRGFPVATVLTGDADEQLRNPCRPFGLPAVDWGQRFFLYPLPGGVIPSDSLDLSDEALSSGESFMRCCIYQQSACRLKPLNNLALRPELTALWASLAGNDYVRPKLAETLGIRGYDCHGAITESIRWTHRFELAGVSGRAERPPAADSCHALTPRCALVLAPLPELKNRSTKPLRLGADSAKIEFPEAAPAPLTDSHRRRRKLVFFIDALLYQRVILPIGIEHPNLPAFHPRALRSIAYSLENFRIDSSDPSSQEDNKEEDNKRIQTSCRCQSSSRRGVIAARQRTRGDAPLEHIDASEDADKQLTALLPEKLAGSQRLRLALHLLRLSLNGGDRRSRCVTRALLALCLLRHDASKDSDNDDDKEDEGPPKKRAGSTVDFDCYASPRIDGLRSPLISARSALQRRGGRPPAGLAARLLAGRFVYRVAADMLDGRLDWDRCLASLADRLRARGATSQGLQRLADWITACWVQRVLVGDKCTVSPPDGAPVDALFALETPEKTWEFCAENTDDRVAWTEAVASVVYVENGRQVPAQVIYHPDGNTIVVYDDGRPPYCNRHSCYGCHSCCAGDAALGFATGALLFSPLMWWPCGTDRCCVTGLTVHICAATLNISTVRADSQFLLHLFSLSESIANFEIFRATMMYF